MCMATCGTVCESRRFALPNSHCSCVAPHVKQTPVKKCMKLHVKAFAGWQTQPRILSDLLLQVERASRHGREPCSGHACAG